MQKHSLSVLVPAYNEEDVVHETIKSLSQFLDSIKDEVEDYEIIICINGSFDKTEEIARDLAMKNSRIKYFALKDKGFGIALREGIKLARMDIITYFPSDGEVEPSFIKASLKNMDRYDFIVGSRYLQGEKVVNPTSIRRIPSIMLVKLFRACFSKRFSEIGTIKMFKRTWAQKVNKHCKSKDFSWQVEICYWAIRDNLRIMEVPIRVILRRSPSLSKVSILRDGISLFLACIKYGLQVTWIMSTRECCK